MTEAEILEYVDTPKALERIRGNKKLFKTLLTHFLATEKQFEQLRGEIGANDRDAAAKTIHAIKGVAGNLSMTKLFEQSPPFEALVKSGGDTAAAFAEYDATYKKTIECVKALMETLVI